MLHAPDGFPDWLRLAVCGGIGVAGVVVLPLVLGVVCRKTGRRPSLGLWLLCVGGCAACVLGAFAVDVLIARSDERRQREHAERIGLVRVSEGSTSEEYQSPSGWSAAAPATAGSGGGRATYMRMSVRKAAFPDAAFVVVAEVLAVGLAGLVFYGVTRRRGA